MPCGEPSRLPVDAAFRLLDHLPGRLASDAAALYLSALADMLVPVYGRGPRAHQALAAGFDRRMCICALHRDQLAGLIGMQTATAGFTSVSPSILRCAFGRWGGFWRGALLGMLQYRPFADEVRIDGVAVAPAWQGRGVGSRLIGAMQAWAFDQGIAILSLEVVDANAGALGLYRRLGFAAVREQTVWPFMSLLGFAASTVMVKMVP